MKVIRKHFRTVHSTNSWAKEHKNEFAQDQLTLITVDEQTAGRGRFDRVWVSPPGQNVYASFCFFVPGPCQGAINISQMLAVPAVRTLEQLGVEAQIKWPNDLMIENKKVAGILCETTPVGDKTCVIIGIGINVNMSVEQLAQIDQPATSLMVEKGCEFLVEKVISILSDQFYQDLNETKKVLR